MSFAPARMKPLVNGESSQAFSQDSFAEAIANIRRVTLITHSHLHLTERSAILPTARIHAQGQESREQEVGADAGNHHQAVQEVVRGRVSGRG